MNRIIAALTLLAVAGCTATTTAPALTPAQIVADTNTIIAGLNGAVNALTLADPKLLTPAELATIRADIADAQAATTALSTAMPAQTAAGPVHQAVADINAVLNVLAGPPVNGFIPSPENMAIAAVAALAPTLDAFVFQYIPTTAATAPVFAASMTPAQARTILAKYAR